MLYENQYWTVFRFDNLVNAMGVRSAFGALAHAPFAVNRTRARATSKCDAVPPHVADVPAILPPAQSLPSLPPAPKPRLSLPTSAERRWFIDNGVSKGRNQKFIKSLSFTFRVNQLHNAPEWAYIVHTRASKSVLGKRTVFRNRAKRRLRAAAAQVLPAHATRRNEYAFSALPEACTLEFTQLVEEIAIALKAANCYEDRLPFELMRRRRGKRHRESSSLSKDSLASDEDSDRALEDKISEVFITADDRRRYYHAY